MMSMLWLRSLQVFFLLVATVNAFHFYLDANEKRCFIEELPTDTVVEGARASFFFLVIISYVKLLSTLQGTIAL